MLFVQEIISNEKWDIVNPDEYANIKTHQAAIYIKSNKVIYFKSLLLNIFQKKLKNLQVIKTLLQISSEYKNVIH